MITLDIDAMRTLIAIAETGGITSAAEQLNLSQSAVSHKMKRLENRLSRNLFFRSNGRLKFSYDGEKLLGYARKMIRLHDEACSSFQPSNLSGKLRLGITEDVSVPRIAQILSRFTTSYPNVTLTSRVAHTPDLKNWLEKDEIDMALIEVFEGERLDSDYQLGKQQPVWLYSDNFILDSSKPIPFVSYHKNCIYKTWAETTLSERDQRIQVVFESPGINGLVNAVRCGLGIALVNLDVFEKLKFSEQPGNAGLKLDHTILPRPPATQHVARFSSGTPTKQMSKLLELIKQALLPGF